MLTGWRYRLTSVLGVALFTALAVLVANLPSSQFLVTAYVPGFWNLEPTVLTGRALLIALVLPVAAVAGCFIPLYKPRPRRVLDVVALAQKRVVAAVCMLATVGYFNYSYRLPRTTVVVTGLLLFVSLPGWFVLIRGTPRTDAGRTLVVGDDLPQIRRIVAETDLDVVGYLCPPGVEGPADAGGHRVAALSDGGVEIEGLERFVGLSRIEDVLVEHDIDTVVLAFERADRGEFFGTLDACYEHGVGAKVHREYADAVLTGSDDVGPLVDVEIEPWDVQDHVIKRGFDVAFAGVALLALLPVVVAIVAAIELEGEGPVLFSQERTYLFGETFTVHKFRTLKPDPAGEVGTSFSGDRETRLGNFLRATHLDEIPQLWSILVGDMSVVGPRPAQTALEGDFQAEAAQWRQRWFVKPGLTGLAQINDATSSEPREKIQYDLRYIRNQSLRFDLQILARQLWKVVEDVAALASERDEEPAE